MIKEGTREHAIAVILHRADQLQPGQILSLVDQLPVDVEEAATDFSTTVGLSPAELKLIIQHNVSVAWELLEYAQAKQLYGRKLRVGLPPRNEK